MTEQLHPDLSRWLAVAIKGLPRDAAARTQEEILAHYEDALDDYQAQGLTLAQAHQQVMADLGAANLTACGLSDVHRGQTHYRIASVASLCYLLLLFVAPKFMQVLNIDGSIAIFVARTGLEVYVLLVLSWLIRWRVQLPALDTAFWLIIGGIIGEYGGVILDLVFFGSSAVGEPAFTAFQFTRPWQSLLAAGVDLSRLAAAAGLFFIGLKLIRVDGSLFGLGKALAVLSMLMGAGLLGATVMAYAGLETGAVLASMLVMLGHVLTWPLLTLIFFRAFYRSPVKPARLA